MDKKIEKKTSLAIPVDVAKGIATDFDKDQVVILSWNREHCSTTVTTYGKTIHDSDQAAESGNKIKHGLGWPEQDCKAKSVRVEAMLNALEAARFELSALNADKSTAYRLIDNILRVEGNISY